jgi:hypothetical protein
MNEYLNGNTHPYPPTNNILYKYDNITRKKYSIYNQKKIGAADVYRHRHRHTHI